MVGPTVLLFFKLKQSPLIKDSNILYKDKTHAANKEQPLLKQKRSLLTPYFLENQSAHFQ